MPRVTVIGTGYLGLTHAVCLADLGHEVLAIDVDAEKIAMAANGEAPFFEPGLEPLLRKNLDSGRLRSEKTTRDRYAVRGYASTAVKHGIAVFIAIHNALAGKPWIPPIPAAT